MQGVATRRQGIELTNTIGRQLNRLAPGYRRDTRQCEITADSGEGYRQSGYVESENDCSLLGSTR